MITSHSQDSSGGFSGVFLDLLLGATCTGRLVFFARSSGHLSADSAERLEVREEGLVDFDQFVQLSFYGHKCFRLRGFA